MFVASLSASAYDFMVDGIAYNKNADGTSVTVTYTEFLSTSNYEGGSGTLSIPERVTYNGKTYSVTAIGNYAFEYCSGFTGALTIPNSVTTIGSSAFKYCSGFTGALTIPNSVTTIGEYTFCGCSKLTGEVIIPDGVSVIRENAFYNCSKITKLVIGKSVELIYPSAFYGMKGLKTVVANPATPIEIVDNVFSGVNKASATLYVPFGSEQLYAEANVWKDFGIIKMIRKLGDVNGDNVVNTSDITALISMVLGETEYNLEIGDINGDGCVDVSDVTVLINLILGGE